MKPKQLAEHDMGAVFGLPRVLVQNLPVIACTKCENFLVPGPVVDYMASQLVSNMLTSNFPLGGTEIRFLRKAMGLTQEQLAERLGIDRVTVARWETDKAREAIGMPESIAIRTVLAASEKSPVHVPPTEQYRVPPVAHPNMFRLDAPPHAADLVRVTA